jgi:hypothetical protein
MASTGVVLPTFAGVRLKLGCRAAAKWNTSFAGKFFNFDGACIMLI